MFEAVEKHYGIKIEYTFPDADETKELVRNKGMFSFYEDGHQECCRVRKVESISRFSMVLSLPSMYRVRHAACWLCWRLPSFVPQASSGGNDATQTGCRCGRSGSS